jgi:hypothetical protein
VQRLGLATPRYLLTSAHVLATGGATTVGDPVVQPSWDSDSDPNNQVAVVTESTPIQFSTATFPNLCDAGIAALDSVDFARRDISLIGAPVGVSSIISRGMTVMKTGRSTGFTTGIVKDVDFKTAIKASTPSGTRRAGFRDQVLCTCFTSAGDSGAAVLSKKSGKVIGLHCAGSTSTSIFNRITHVFRALSIELA